MYFARKLLHGIKNCVHRRPQSVALCVHDESDGHVNFIVRIILFVINKHHAMCEYSYIPYLATQTECIALIRVPECVSRRDPIILFFFLDTHHLSVWVVDTSTLRTIVHYMTVKLWHFILFGAAAVTHWARDFRTFAITLGYDLWTSTQILLDNVRSLEPRHSNVIAKTEKDWFEIEFHIEHTRNPHCLTKTFQFSHFSKNAAFDVYDARYTASCEMKKRSPRFRATN